MPLTAPRFRSRIIALIAVFLVSCGALATPSSAVGTAEPATLEKGASQAIDEWMALLINGQKSGYLHTRRVPLGNTIETTQEMQWRMQRNGVPLVIEVIESGRESTDGKPLSFRSEQRLSKIIMRVEGRLRDGKTLEITKSGLGPVTTKRLPWNPEWVLPETHRLRQIAAFRKQGMRPGSKYTDWVFVPSLEKAVKTTTVLGQPEDVDLLGQTQRLWHITETADMGFIKQVSDAWVDDQFNVKKMRLEMMGMQLEMIACPKACATADGPPFEAFANTVVPVPRPLVRSELAGPLEWTFAIKKPVTELHLPESEEQHVWQRVDKNGQQLVIRVNPAIPPLRSTALPAKSSGSASPGSAEENLDDWRKPTAWLQSDANLIVGLAKKAVRANQSKAEQMQAITNFVRHYISDKNLSVAYASALETAKYRNGDCTEHALLTAAMGRAVGIPTRIATGLAYVPDLDGRKHVLVPHAWTQAFVDGRWKSYDAAIGRFDSGHIALEYGDGDPRHFYSGIQLIGNLTLKSVKPDK